LDARAGAPHRFLFGASPELRALADGHREEHLRRNPAHADREYLLSVFEEVGRLPGARHLFDRRHNRALTLAPTADGAKELLRFFRSIEPETGATVHDFVDPAAGTRFLGDLYQDLSESARKTYALLQTPDFVEEFLLDRTLTPAIEALGYEKVTLIDPACGSGHFLLGAFHRLARLWQENQPGLPGPAIAQNALSAVFGVDLNPYAAAIARFRLLVAALKQAGVARLADAPDLKVNVAVGDSLLHGPVPGKRSEDRQLFLVGEDPLGHLYETEDADELRRILGRRYHAVVANPPYITVKDAGLNQLYRSKFSTCKGKYSLVCPFMERLVDLCEQPGADGRGTAGWLGAIVSNAFMKREFGSKLVEEFLPKWDLTHVLDTSGAWIPGHGKPDGTPTAILVMRGRKPLGTSVRAVMGIRGEPKPPEDPARGLVWSEIVGLADQSDEKGLFVSVSDVERERFAKHPWSLGGGGAAELKELIEEHANWPLNDVVDAIGVFGMTNADEAMLAPPRAFARQGVEAHAFCRLVIGDDARDWGIGDGEHVLFPYETLSLLPLDRVPGMHRWLWPARTTLGNRATFSKETYFTEGRPWWEWHQVTLGRLRTPLSITFAFVATHNHFVLDRGGKVFKQTAPIIKLPASASEEDHTRLLGLLNSSTACFWLKSNCFNKGMGEEHWADRFEYDGSKLLSFPIPSGWQAGRREADTVDTLARQRAKNLPPSILSSSRPASTRATLDAARATAASLRRRQIALQEELDWQVYRLYDLIDDDLTYEAHGGFDAVPEVALGERAFEIVLARAMTAGEVETKWFERHGSTPITEIPERWPAAYRDLVERRIASIATNANIALIEKPEYKRRWAQEPWEEMESRAFRSWLLARLEEPRCWPSAELQSTTHLADRVRRDEDFLEVARLYSGRPDVDVEALVKELVLEEGVPYLAAFRYAESGLRKRALWEETWALQRREDRGEDVGTIPVPPKYDSKDFAKASYWSHRGKLDVPKEEFVLYPGAERSVDPSPVCGWAGWDHLQRAKALSAWYEKVKANEGWPKEKLVPLLAGLQELVPWLLQWHDEPDPEFGVGMGTYFADYVDQEARDLGCSLRTSRTGGRRRERRVRAGRAGCDRCGT
ncbi:MAG: BREX-2 system adenine-specific DNA-methyltransferase PglX, partial [Thermoanaerobaculia bacterium]|nr:BREX-2 system adenine-specific DNA-methyltransferase PglX [Thermoanaerobaculia bacterium]